MDELWQRYRTFWTPVLIGIGIFLAGLIAVHIISDDPEDAARRAKSKARKLKKMQKPDSRKITALRNQAEVLKKQNAEWGLRLDQSGSGGKRMIEAAAEQCLRAVHLRGATSDEAASPTTLAARFDDDESAARRAIRKYEESLTAHVELLRSGDPNVAFSRLLSEVWGTLRVRANRADVGITPSLGFGAVSSVNRATLPARALTLALVARVVDVAIRHRVQSVDHIRIDPVLRPGNPGDFIMEWPVGFSITGPGPAIMKIIDHVTDPAHPVPIVANSVIALPKGRRAGALSGLVQVDITLASTVVRPDVNLNLSKEDEDA